MKEYKGPIIEKIEKEKKRQDLMAKIGVGVMILSTLIAFTGLIVVAVIGWIVAAYCFWSSSIDKNAPF